jgi:cell division protein FtsW
MSETKKYDTKLFYVTLFLVALGLIMVLSASQILAQNRLGSPFFFFQQQAIRAALGLCLFFIFMKIPFHMYERWATYILVASFLLLAAVFIWGKESRGSTRWIGFSRFMLQPVEAAKLGLVIFLAARISSLNERIQDFKHGFLPLAAVSVAAALLVALQPNISNAIFIVLLSSTILFMGGCRLRHLLPFGIGIAAAASPLYWLLPHVRERVSDYLQSFGSMFGASYHVKQSLLALGSGFFFGCGPGGGHQKYLFLPDAHTDFIYSIIGEELGLTGTVLVLFLFAFLFFRALRTARRSPSTFGYLLAFGLGMSIFATAIINIAVTLGLVPTAGLPLPFISYGGSCLVTSLAGVGIILNISSEGRIGRRQAKVQSRSGRRVYARRARAGNTGRRR